MADADDSTIVSVPTTGSIAYPPLPAHAAGARAIGHGRHGWGILPGAVEEPDATERCGNHQDAGARSGRSAEAMARDRVGSPPSGADHRRRSTGRLRSVGRIAAEPCVRNHARTRVGTRRLRCRQRRHPGGLRPARRGEAAAEHQRRRRGPQVLRRGDRHRQPAASQRRPDLRPHARRRRSPAVGDEVRRGRGMERPARPEAARACEPRGADDARGPSRHPGQGLRRRGLRARARHPAPRPETRERHGRRLRRGAGDGLGLRGRIRRRAEPRGHPARRGDLPDRGHAVVHGPGDGDRQYLGRRPAYRCLPARGHPLRDPHRLAAASRRRRVWRARPGDRGSCRTAERARAGSWHPRRAGVDRDGGAHQGPARTHPERRRLRPTGEGVPRPLAGDAPGHDRQGASRFRPQRSGWRRTSPAPRFAISQPSLGCPCGR